MITDRVIRVLAQNFAFTGYDRLRLEFFVRILYCAILMGCFHLEIMIKNKLRNRTIIKVTRWNVRKINKKKRSALVYNIIILMCEYASIAIGGLLFYNGLRIYQLLC